VSNTHRFISDACSVAALIWDDAGVWSSHTTALFVDVYAKIVGQLPLVAGFVLDTSSRLKTLKSTRRVGSDACVAASLAEQPATAVTLLDRAQGVVWAQALHQRDPQMEGAPKDLSIEIEELLRSIAASAPVDSARLSSQTERSDPSHTARDPSYAWSSALHAGKHVRHTLRSRPQPPCRRPCRSSWSCVCHSYAECRGERASCTSSRPHLERSPLSSWLCRTSGPSK
jgi:hypothetical protein